MENENCWLCAEEDADRQSFQNRSIEEVVRPRWYAVVPLSRKDIDARIQSLRFSVSFGMCARHIRQTEDRIAWLSRPERNSMLVIRTIRDFGNPELGPIVKEYSEKEFSR
jgi:hypothetical protein